MEKVERGVHPALHLWHPGPPTAPWVLAPTHMATSGMRLYGVSLGGTGTLWVHIPSLKGVSVGVTAINPPERVFNQNEHVSGNTGRVGGASASTAWSVLGFVSVR